MSRILEKLKKLISHERSARAIGSMDEAEAFAAKIQQLVGEYNLSLDEIEIESEQSSVEADLADIRTKRLQAWQRMFISRLAEFNGCRIVAIRQGTAIIGAKTDRAIVVEFYNYFEGLAQEFSQKSLSIYRKTGEYKRKRKKQKASINFRESYCFGFVCAIIYRIEAEHAAKLRNASNSQALIYIGNKLVDSDQWINDNMNTSERKSKKRKTRDDAFMQGYEDGESVALTTKTVS